MPELVVESVILIIPYFNEAVFHPEGIAIIFTHFMVIDLYDPVINIFPVKEGNPFFFWYFLLSRRFTT